MNKKDSERFARVEQQLIEQGVPQSIGQLNNFPFKSLEDIKAAHSKKKISFGSNYNGEFLEVIGTGADNIIHMMWLTFPFLIAAADIVLAIIFKNWILLLGIPFALVGFFSSSPFNPMKNTISGLGGLMFFCSFFFFNWTWSVIIGSLLFSQIFAMTAREHYRTVIEERAFHSETFFCFLYRDGHIVIKDTKTNKILATD